MDKSNKNIVLIGMPGCGKTTLGSIIAEKLGKDFIDIDEIIEKQAGCTISEIFLKGENVFRDLETKAVLDLEGKEGIIIAAGGGVVKRAVNMASLRKNGIIVYIDRCIRDISADIDISKRPLLAKDVEQLAELYFERCGLYRQYSDLIVKNEGSICETAGKIIGELSGIFF